MKKKTKIIISSLLSTFAVTSIGLGVGLSLVQKDKINDNIVLLNNVKLRSMTNNGNRSYYKFNNKIYNSIKEAVDDYCSTNGVINENLYIGNSDDAIYDQNYRLLNINKLRKYNKSKILPAYKNAIGGFTESYNKAKKSFVNPGLIQYKYDDLNGRLFDSFEQAKESILSSKFANPIAYYEINNSNNNGIIKINPMNKDDVNEFKKYAVDQLLYGPADNEFKLKVYDVYEQPKFASKEKNYIYKLAYQDFYNNGQSIIANVRTKILNYLSNQINENFKFNVDLRVVTDGAHGQYSTNQFRFYGNGGYSNDIYVGVDSNDQKLLHINNLPTYQLNILNKFFRRDCISGSLELNTTGTFNRKQSYDYHFTLFGHNFEAYSYKNNDGWTKGIDSKVLEPGSDWEDGSMYFDANISMSNPSETFNIITNNLKQYLDSFMSKEFKNLNKNTFQYKYINKYIHNLLNSLENNKQILCNNGNKSINVCHRTKPSDQNRIFGNMSNYIINEMTSDYSNLSLLTKEINPKLEPKNMLNLNNEISQLKFVIEYNGHPVFEIDNKDFLSESGKIEIKNKSNRFNNDYKKILERIKSNKDVNLNENLIRNISTDFNSNCESKAVKTSEYGYKLVNNLISKNSDNTLKMNKNNNDYIQSSTPNVTMKTNGYNIDIAIDSYNKTIKHYNLNNTNLVDVVNPDDVLMLYNPNGTKKELCYSEFLSNQSNYNLSVWKSNIHLYNDYYAIKSALEQQNTLNPGKVVILYDLLGNVINPGVKLNKNEELLTTSDAIYDSETTLLDNVLRTRVIRPNAEYIFYKDSETELELLENKVDMIYSMTFLHNQKTYYFQTFQDAWNYVYNYISNNAEEVVAY